MHALAWEDRDFYRRWIFANGWAQAAGLGTTFVFGREVATLFSEARDSRTVLAGALGAVHGRFLVPLTQKE